ncbi:MAG TPA: hypothetical protein VGH23_18750 [Rhizomicrobium sp.]|jgi:hypothetical protein
MEDGAKLLGNQSIPLQVIFWLFVIAAGVWLKISVDQRSKSDPELAARLARMRGSRSTLGSAFQANRIAWVIGGLGLLMLNQRITQMAASHHWSDATEMSVMTGCIVCLGIVCAIADRLLLRLFRGKVSNQNQQEPN